MLKNVFQTFMTIVIDLAVPLLGNIKVFSKWNVWAVFLGAFLMTICNPSYSIKESVHKTDKDKGSMLILFLTGILAFLIPLLDFTYFSQGQMNHSLLYIGIFLIVVGLFLRYYSVIYLGKFFTVKVQIVEDHQLITSGPYSILRHPSYTAVLLVTLGCAFVTTSYVAIIFWSTVYIASYIYRVKVEEKALKSFFGQKYSDYMKTTKALFPFVY